MALWGSNGASSADAPKYNIEAGTDQTGITSFGNTTVVNGRAVGTFPVEPSEAANSSMIVHPGWVVVRQYTGPVNEITVAAGGSGYTNSDVVVVSGGTSNASATLTTNSTGGITSAVLTSGGAGFKEASSSTLAITTTAGTGANLQFTLGGRAGRACAETLVAISSITGANVSSLPA